MTTLRSVIAYLAAMIRYAGVAYIVVLVALWHSFYLAAPWRLTAPALAVAWALTAVAYLRRRPPSPLLACVDSAFYLVLALGGQACVPPAIRDQAVSWVVVAMSGQLIIPAWSASGPLAALLVLAAPAAYLVGAVREPVTDRRTLAGAAVLLLVVGLVHGWGRRALFGRAAAADAEVDAADRAAREQYAVLSANIARREHERLVHDTVLNTLTAVARDGGNAAARIVTRCRQDVALIEAALGGADDPDAVDPAAAGLLSEVLAVVDDMRARGLTVHLDADKADPAASHPAAADPAVSWPAASRPAVSGPVSAAVAGAVREALANVAAHAGTGEAWVSIQSAGPADADWLRVVVRDQGNGFDPDRVDRARLGLRRSITERAAESGGHAAIWSVPGQGTEVTLTWPAPDQAGQPRPGHALVRPGSSW